MSNALHLYVARTDFIRRSNRARSGDMGNHSSDLGVGYELRKLFNAENNKWQHSMLMDESVAIVSDNTMPKSKAKRLRVFRHEDKYQPIASKRPLPPQRVA
jgi:hypothetical protein